MTDQPNQLPAEPAKRPKPPNRPIKPGVKPTPPKLKPGGRPNPTPYKAKVKKPDISKGARMEAKVTAFDLTFVLEGPMDQVMAILNAIYESPTPPSPAVISKLRLVFGPEVRIKA